jgi:hypothetical protein
LNWFGFSLIFSLLFFIIFCFLYLFISHFFLLRNQLLVCCFLFYSFWNFLNYYLFDWIIFLLNRFITFQIYCYDLFIFINILLSNYSIFLFWATWLFTEVLLLFDIYCIIINKYWIINIRTLLLLTYSYFFLFMEFLIMIPLPRLLRIDIPFRINKFLL